MPTDTPVTPYSSCLIHLLVPFYWWRNWGLAWSSLHWPYTTVDMSTVWNQTTCVCIPVLPFTSCEILGKLFSPLCLSFFICKMRIITDIHRTIKRVNIWEGTQHSAWHTVCSKCLLLYYQCCLQPWLMLRSKSTLQGPQIHQTISHICPSCLDCSLHTSSWPFSRSDYVLVSEACSLTALLEENPGQPVSSGG